MSKVNVLLKKHLPTTEALELSQDLWLSQRAEPERIKAVDAGRPKRLAKLLVKARGELRQEVVARMVGKTQSWLAKVEKTGRVSFTMLERLAIIYNEPLDRFRTLPLHEVVSSEGKYLGRTQAQWNVNARRYAAGKVLRKNPLVRDEGWLAKMPRR